MNLLFRLSYFITLNGLLYFLFTYLFIFIFRISSPYWKCNLVDVAKTKNECLKIWSDSSENWSLVSLHRLCNKNFLRSLFMCLVLSLTKRNDMCNLYMDFGSIWNPSLFLCVQNLVHHTTVVKVHQRDYEFSMSTETLCCFVVLWLLIDVSKYVRYVTDNKVTIIWR